MAIKRAAQLVICVAFAWPSQAYAQRIPEVVVILGLMPVLALILAIVLGVLKRSWLVGLGNLGFAALCVAWFVAAAKLSKSDLMNWAPIGVLGLHLAGMLFSIGLHAFRRRRSDDV